MGRSSPTKSPSLTKSPILTKSPSPIKSSKVQKYPVSLISKVRTLLNNCLNVLYNSKDNGKQNINKATAQMIEKVSCLLALPNQERFLPNQRSKKHDQAQNPISKLKQQLNLMNKYNEALKQINQKQKNQLNKLQEQRQSLQKKLDIADKQIREKQKDFEAQLVEINRKQSQRRRQSNQPDQQTHVYLGQLLYGEPDFKEYVSQILAIALKRKPIHARRLYQMDLLNHVNFHQYIDNHPNLLLVVKLKNNLMLAAFQEQPLMKNMVSTGLGLIFSLSNRKCFKNQKKAVVYDSHHLIFGNNEIKIMSNKTKIYSNLGVNNGYYENHHQNVDILFGQGKSREVEMDHYEILEVIFD